MNSGFLTPSDDAFSRELLQDPDKLNEAVKVLYRATKHRLNGIAPGARILDLGAGPGSFLPYLRELEPENLVALDLNQRLLKMGAKKAIADSYLQANATKLPFQDESFDLIVCLSVFQWLNHYERHQAVDEMSRVLRLGGKLLIATIHPQHYRMIDYVQNNIEAINRRIANGDYPESVVNKLRQYEAMSPSQFEEYPSSYFVDMGTFDRTDIHIFDEVELCEDGWMFGQITLMEGRKCRFVS